MRKAITILVTSVGSTTALSVIKSLRQDSDRKYRIIGTDINPLRTIPGNVFTDVTYRVPEAKRRSYIPALRKICIREGVQFIIPIVDLEVELLAKNRSILQDVGARVCASDYVTVKSCNDKYATYRALQAKNVSSPPVNLQSELSKESIYRLHFPLFIKPRRGCSSIDAYRVESYSVLQSYFTRRNDFIVQPFLKGNQFVIDVCNDANGKNIVSIPRREIVSKSGIGVKAETCKDKALQSFGVRISEALNIKGVANIEVLKRGNKISLIEVNPRFSAGSIISTAAGVNLAALTIGVFSGSAITHNSNQWLAGVYMTRYWQEVFYYRHRRLKLAPLYENPKI
ncbi:MAG: ATP-grasp domain-containing protein [Patescibacteria group bacterium]|mgnify:CR=1 FL=1